MRGVVLQTVHPVGEKGFTFSIVAALGTSPATQRTGLMAAANQAIVAGPRR